jgi:hypothetical protein
MKTQNIVWLFMLIGIVAAGMALGCGDDDDDDDDDVADDDDDSDDDADDDTSDDLNDDADDDADDDLNDDADDDLVADDYIATWPQSNIEGPDYDESPNPGPLRQKAVEYDDWHLANHQPYYGGTVRIVFTDETRSVVDHYFDWNDSCEWTGLYLGSQAVRYHATGDEQARQNVIRMVEMLSGNLHITGTPGYIARYWADQDALIYPGDEWCDAPEQRKCSHIEDGPDAGKWWWGETSRDMYNGWFFGMSMAYDLVDDEAMREVIRDDVEHVLTVLMSHNWMILNEIGRPTGYAPDVMPPFRLAWLTIGYHITGSDAFRQELAKWLKNDQRILLRFLSITFMNRYAEYFGSCLSHEYWYNLLRLGKVYFSDDDNAFLLNLFNTQIHTYTRLSHNPWFNGVFMSQGAYIPEEVDDPYQAQLEQDLSDFRPAPMYRYHLEAKDPATYTLDPLSVFLSDLMDDMPLFREIIGDVDYQAMEAFPIDQQCSTDFLFQRNPFQIEECGSDSPALVNAGVDYLIAYWLASYHRFISKDM